MDKEIIIPIYYTEDDKKNKIIDEESMRLEFEDKLCEVVANTKKD